ncbi:MAG: DUF2730 family protein [Ferrovibrionaceae bacterium]
MEFEALRQWVAPVGTIFGLLGGVASLISSIFWLRMRAAFVSKADHDALFAKVGVQATELTALRSAISNLPSKDDVHQLNVSIERLRGDLKAAEAGRKEQERYQRTIEEMLHRHDDILSEAARRRMRDGG